MTWESWREGGHSILQHPRCCSLSDCNFWKMSRKLWDYEVLFLYSNSSLPSSKRMAAMCELVRPRPLCFSQEELIGQK